MIHPCVGAPGGEVDAESHGPLHRKVQLLCEDTPSLRATLCAAAILPTPAHPGQAVFVGNPPHPRGPQDTPLREVRTGFCEDLLRWVNAFEKSLRQKGPGQGKDVAGLKLGPRERTLKVDGLKSIGSVFQRCEAVRFPGPYVTWADWHWPDGTQAILPMFRPIARYRKYRMGRMRTHCCDSSSAPESLGE